MEGYKYPDNEAVYVKRFTLNAERQRAIDNQKKTHDEQIKKQNKITQIAVEQLMWIEPPELDEIITQRGNEAVKTVDVRAKDMSKETVPYKIRGSICFDIVGTTSSDLTDAVFQERVDKAAQYGAEKIFPHDIKDFKDFPEAVVFYCKQGSTRSPMMGFRYAQYVLKLLASKSEDWEKLPLRPRVYVVNGGLDNFEDSLREKLWIDKDGKEYPHRPYNKPFYKPPEPRTQPQKLNLTRNVRPRQGGNDPPPTAD